MPYIPFDIRPAFPQPAVGEGVRPKLLELLGLDDLPTEVDFTIDRSREEGGLHVSSVRFANSLGETVPGILCVPQERGNELPGVVCVPGTSKSAETVAAPHFREEPSTGALHGWGRELARRGFATLSITVKGTVSRRASIEDWATENKLLNPYGRQQMGILVEETLGAARILASLEGVDSGRIGLTGWSLGGSATWYGAACEPWIAAAVPVMGGVGSMARAIHEGDVHRASAYFYIPHMLRFFDHPQVVADCIAPRPFMMVAPTMDQDMPLSGVEDLKPIVSRAYEAAGHPERFKVYQPENTHVYLAEYFEWVAAWLAEHLDA